MILFVDYNFSLQGNNIIMDSELKPESLGVKNGDVLTVVVTDDNRIILRKTENAGNDRENI